MYRYIVEVRNHKLLVNINCKEDVVKESIRQLAERGSILEVNIKDVRLQVYDPLLNFHYDVCSTSELPDTCVIKIEVPLSNMEIEASCTNDTSVALPSKLDLHNLSINSIDFESPRINLQDLSTNNISIPAVMSESILNDPVVSAANMILPANDPTIKVASSGSSDFSSDCGISNVNILESSNSISSTSTLKPWPIPFQLDETMMPASLLNSLKKKIALSTILESNLMEFLYDSMTKYTFFPTSAQYKEVVELLLHKFPYLASIDIGDSVQVWKCRLSMKARNSRRRRDKTLQCVIMSKEKRKLGAKKKETITNDEGAKQTPSKKQCLAPSFGCLNYLPARPLSEDHESVLKHMKDMKSESSKKKTNGKFIADLMERTFFHRRQMTVKMSASISTLKAEFPCLFDEFEMVHELQRITGVQIMESIHSYLTIYAIPLLKMSSCYCEVATEIANLNDAQRNEKLCSEALCCLPDLLKENCVFNSSSKISPTIKLDNPTDPSAEGILYAENEELCHISGVVRGMAVWVAAYYNFNMSYPKDCKKTLIFLQRIVFGLRDATKVPMSVMTLVKNLNNLIEESKCK